MKEKELFWHKGPWERMRGAWTQGRFPHAVLLAGPPGMGKRHFAVSLAAFVLCDQEAAEARPCGQCRGCRLFAGQSHPDYYRVDIPDDKKTIGVDQIRAVCERVERTSHRGGYQVVIVGDADRMTRNASNSLLKTLEEPQGATLLLLISSRPARLLPTIRSRCQLLRFARPNRERTIEWLRRRQDGVNWLRLLNLASGAPLAAIRLHEQKFDELDVAFRRDIVEIAAGRRDPVAVSKTWDKHPPAVWLAWLQTQVLAIIRARSNSDAEPASGEQECEPVDLIKATVNINLRRLYFYLDDLVAAGWRAEGSLRSDLMIAALLIPWASALDYTPVYREW